MRVNFLAELVERGVVHVSQPHHREGRRRHAPDLSALAPHPSMEGLGIRSRAAFTVRGDDHENHAVFDKFFLVKLFETARSALVERFDIEPYFDFHPNDQTL